MIPKLQLALDLTDLDQAIAFIRNSRNLEHIDVVEIGTVLLASAGHKAISVIKKHAPNKEIVADFKVADAAKTLVSMFYDEGADYTTIIAAASPVSMAIAQKVSEEKNKTLQIELYGDWDKAKAEEWYQTGIQHIIYHHSRDANESWTVNDLEKIRVLQSIGFIVSVTGGLKPETIKMFKNMEVYSFIVGRTIYESNNPGETVSAFQKEINKTFIKEAK